MKLRFILPILLPLSYLLVSFYLLGPLGGAGHGSGIVTFFYISLPSILLAIFFDWALPQHGLTVWLGLAGGVLQYGLLGYAVAYFLTRKK
jgi:hypothetical protein